jgi:hypothetical protein
MWAAAIHRVLPAKRRGSWKDDMKNGQDRDVFSGAGTSSGPIVAAEI